MTATPSDPLATQHDSTPDRNDQTPADAQRLLEENRALRELLAAQVSAQLPRPPGPLRRLAWWLISAPGPRWYAGAACLAARTPRPSPAGAWAGPRSPRSIPWRSTARSCCWSCTGAHPPGAHRRVGRQPVRLPLQPRSRCQAWDRNMPTAPRKNPATRRSASRRRPRPPPRHQHPQSMHRRARRMPTRRRLRPLPRSRPSRPGARARPHSPDHRNPRRTARQLAGRIESRAATLRRLELLRPAGLRLGRTQAILRTQPRWGTVKECPARP